MAQERIGGTITAPGRLLAVLMGGALAGGGGLMAGREMSNRPAPELAECRAELRGLDGRLQALDGRLQALEKGVARIEGFLSVAAAAEVSSGSPTRPRLR